MKVNKLDGILFISVMVALTAAFLMVLLKAPEDEGKPPVSKEEKKFKAKRHQLWQELQNFKDTIPEQPGEPWWNYHFQVVKDTVFQRVYEEYLAMHPKEKAEFDKSVKFTNKLNFEIDSLIDVFRKNWPKDTAEINAALRKKYEVAEKAGLKSTYDIWRVGYETFYLPVLPAKLQEEYDRIHKKLEHKDSIRAEKIAKFEAEQEKYLRRYADTIGYKKYK